MSYYEKLLLSGEQGIATLFAEIMLNKLVIYNKQGDGYLYNEETSKHDKKLKCILVDIVPNTLIPIIDDVISNTREDMDFEDDCLLKKMKELKNIKRMIQTLRGCQTIYKASILKLLNTEFKNTEIQYKNLSKIKEKNKEEYSYSILSFIKEKCIEATDKEDKENYKVLPSVLYDEYKNFCNSKNIMKASIQIFGKFISKKYGNKKSIRNFNNKIEKFYIGIKIL